MIVVVGDGDFGPVLRRFAKEDRSTRNLVGSLTGSRDHILHVRHHGFPKGATMSHLNVMGARRMVGLEFGTCAGRRDPGSGPVFHMGFSGFSLIALGAWRPCRANARMEFGRGARPYRALQHQLVLPGANDDFRNGGKR